MIKYGISENYLPDWTIQDALREIYQNFEDYGEYEESIEGKTERGDDYCMIRLYNNYKPANTEFLKIGESYKRDNKHTIGEHGEGLKMAFLVLTRNNLYCQVRHRTTAGNSNQRVYRGKFYQDEHLGKCFGLGTEISNRPVLKDHNFRVCIKVPIDEFKKFSRKKIQEGDVIHHSYYGDIINRPAGEVYVGGLFVCQEEGLNYAYNFKPENISLGRDRKIPRAFDIEWQASKILETWEKTKVEDFTSRDTSYVDRVPKHISKKFKPELIEGKVVFRAKEIQAPNRVSNALLKEPGQQRAVAKLTYSLSKKRKPKSLLKEFYDTHHHSMTPKMQVEFNVLLKKSENWK